MKFLFVSSPKMMWTRKLTTVQSRMYEAEDSETKLKTHH